jgi:hypothetical protein
MIICAFAQVIGHFWLVKPTSETEIKLLRLMSTFHRDFAGGSMSPKDIQDGLNLFYSLFLLYVGLINLILFTMAPAEKKLLTKITLLTSIMLITGSLISLLFFFWLPVVLFLATAIGFLVTHRRLKSARS